MLHALGVLELYDLRFYLLDKEAQTRHIVADFLVVAEECLSKGDGALVVDEQDCWRDL